MEYLVEPWAHQLKAIDNARPRANYALFFEVGAGKTGTCINILREKFNAEKRFLRTLILCPPIVIKNWKDEFAKHSKVDPERIVLLTGPGTRRIALLERHGFAGDGSRQGAIFVTNYETLLMPDLYAKLQAWNPEALVLDESHKCKDSKAKRTKLAMKLANGDTKNSIPPIRYRYLLSGTPILNSPMDIFSQYYILDGGATFGHNFFAFRATYFRDRNAGMPRHKYFPDWVLKPGALEAMSVRMAQSSMRVEKKDCLDLPPLVCQTIKVGMTPAQKRMYEEMKKDFITFMETPSKETAAVVATLAITKALRLMQITSGFAKTAEGQELTLGITPKQEALRELLEELAPHSKVIIWAVWKENYEQIRKVCRDLDLDYVEITGETPAASRFENVDRFNNDPKCRVFIGHPGSGGIGINLVSSNVCIFYSRTFSLEHSLQAEARNHRGGSEIHETVTRIDLVCEGTIDELVKEALAKKIEVSDKVLKSHVLFELKKQETT